jgi:uncharacterized membrane protein YfhO
MAFYLIPTAFLLADLFLEKKRLLYIILESLVIANAVLWGHMQSAVIVSMGVFVYMAVFSFKKIRLSTFLFYFIALIFLVIMETLPQLVPTYELFGQSSRSSHLDYLQGSLDPHMAIFSFVPYLLGGYKNFIGQQISDGFNTEVYNYVGISSMMLSFLALLLLKKSRDIVLAFVFIWIFLILGFMAYNNLVPDNTPLITLFREWERTAALSSFGIALLAGIFIEKINEVSLKNMRAGILFILSPIVYIWILIRMDTGKVARRIGPYVSYHYIQTYPYFSILKTIVLVLAGVILLFFIFKKWHPRISLRVLLAVKVILVAVVFFDLIYFSRDVLAFRIQDISSYKIPSAPQELENKRAILNSLSVWGMESLYCRNWSPLGVSQLKEKEYVNYYAQLGINLRGVPSSNNSLPKDYQNLKEAGIVAITNIDGITYLNDNELDLIKNNVAGHYVEKKEGHIIMQINNPADATINTYLRYNPYWKVKVDGQETKITQDGIFFDFPLSKGDHLVEIDYYPWPFFLGIIISSLLLIIAVSLYYLFRKSLYEYILRRE